MEVCTTVYKFSLSAKSLFHTKVFELEESQIFYHIHIISHVNWTVNIHLLENLSGNPVAVHVEVSSFCLSVCSSLSSSSHSSWTLISAICRPAPKEVMPACEAPLLVPACRPTKPWPARNCSLVNFGLFFCPEALPEALACKRKWTKETCSTNEQLLCEFDVLKWNTEASSPRRHCSVYHLAS